MDINQLMKQAADMQKKMQEMQETQAKTEYDGASGGGMVKITMSGDGNMKKITLDKSLINADEKEMLEDLIIAAFNDAKKKAEEASGDKMSSLLGPLAGKMPGDIKFPF